MSWQWHILGCGVCWCVFHSLCSLFVLFFLVRRYAVNNPDQKVQPILVNNVAQAILRAILSPHSIGQTYHLAGPEVTTTGALYSYVGRQIHQDSKAAAQVGLTGKLGETLGVIGGTIIENLPWKWKGTTADHAKLAHSTDLVMPNKTNIKTIEDLGVTPIGMDRAAPTHLLRHCHNRGPSRFEGTTLKEYNMGNEQITTSRRL